MKFNFIIPSWDYWTEPTRAQPLTQLYLATILRNDGHEVEFTDNREKPTIPSYADAYLYTVASPDFKEVKAHVNMIRYRDHIGIHIAGGPHPSIFPKQTLEIFDAIVIGKGEESLRQIARDMKTDSVKKEYREPVQGPYPFPRRDFLPRDKIVTSLFKTIDIPSTTVLFSHGCPYSCTFCANYTKGSIIRRPLEDITNELEYLKSDYNIKGISLQDEICIPPKVEDAKKFLSMLETQGLYWRGQSRAGVHESILEQAARSKCLELSFGLESVNQDTLDFARKNMKVETVRETIKLAHKYGIKVRLYLLNGLPRESEDVVQKTKDFINDINPEVVLLSTLQPYPGSDIHDNPKKYGIKWIDTDYSKYNHLRCRFKDSDDKIEDVVPFEYEVGFSRKRIVENLLNLQEFLRQREMVK
jgi:radical SAM superfamily enzyme YgiQ (UPF0313 family)